MSERFRRVLVVDDNEDVREMSAEMLRDLGYDVIAAADGFEALDRLAENPELDVVISDIRMPGMSGFELHDAVSERYQNTKVVLMSGFSVAQTPPCRFIRKPFRTSELDLAIRDVLVAPPST